MRSINLILHYFVIGLAVLLWENLVGAILGIYAPELRRTIWGIAYYGLLFLFFGGAVEAINFIYNRISPQYRWFGQRYVWLLVILLIFLWGDLPRQFLIKFADSHSIPITHKLNLFWVLFVPFAGWIVNVMLARRAHANRLPSSSRLHVYFSITAFYLVVSTKVTARYFQDDVLSSHNVVLQPLLFVGACAVFLILKRTFNTRASYLRVVFLFPIVATAIVLSFSYGLICINQATSYEAFPPTDQPNFVLLLCDALCADHVGAISEAHDLTPTVDALAQQGRAYKSCYSTSSWTFPAVVSLLTSRLPSRLGALEAGILPKNVPTLPQILRKNGYYTACLSTNEFLSDTYGFDYFFDEFNLLRGKGKNQLFLPYDTFLPYPWFLDELAYQFGFVSVGYLMGDCWEMNRRAENLLSESRSKPFFLYMHYAEPHSPYFTVPFQDGAFDLEKLRLIYDVFALEPDERLDQVFSPEDLKLVRKTLHERYMNGVRTVDSAIGQMMQILARMGISSNTVILIAADHGEEFLEHGRLGHKSSLFEQQIEIPLIIFIPRGLGIELPDQPDGASIMDIAPTVLDIAGIDRGMLNGGGTSLLQASPGEHRSRFSMLARREGCAIAVVRGRHKLILVTDLREDKVDTLLFDLSLDKAERINLYPQERCLADSLATLLQEQLNQPSDNLQISPPGQTPIGAQRLRALGYVQ